MRLLPRSLINRITLLVGVVLLLLALFGAALFLRGMFKDVIGDTQENAQMVIEVVAVAVTDSVVVNDYDAIRRTLEKALVRAPFESAVFIAMDATRLEVLGHATPASDAPGWLIRRVENELAEVNRAITVGGRDYGVIRLNFAAARIAGNIWSLSLHALGLLLGAFALGLAAVRLALGQWLGYLKQLGQAGRQVIDGQIETIALDADAPSEVKQAMEAISRSTESLRTHFGSRIDALMDSLVQQKNAMDEAAIVSEFDPAARLTYVNDLFCRTVGVSREQLIGDLITRWGDVGPEGAAAPAVWHGEVSLRRRDGARLYFQRTVVPIFDTDKALQRQICIDFDVTGEVKARNELRKLSLAVENSGSAIMMTDANAIIGYVNPQFSAMTGYSLAEVKGQSALLLRAESTPLDTYEQIWLALFSGHTWRGEFADRRKDGAEFRCQKVISTISHGNGAPEQYVWVMEDVTDRIRSEETIHRLAFVDTLTGLPNRRAFRARADELLKMARRNDEGFAILYFDLDRFKSVNDRFGHGVGDQLLSEASRRIQGCLREVDVVSRFGGDEFAALITSTADPVEVSQVARRIIDALEAVFAFGDNEAFISTSIGIALYPRDAAEISELLRCADLALYRAKDQGRGTAVFFSQAIEHENRERMELEHALRNVLGSEQLFLEYQPKLSLRDGRVIGAEALLRWQHPTRGRIGPDRFIPIAEESRMIVPIGRWVVRSVCQQIREWRAAGMGGMQVAINLSGLQFKSETLLQDIVEALAENGLEASCLELELTESLTIENPEQTIELMKRFRAMGISIAIDDFGQGHSALAYLKRFPLNTLKIDRAFVRDLTTNPDDEAIVHMLVALAKTLNLSLVAEGVETVAQLQYLRDLDVDAIQGYWFSRPLLAADFGAFCRAHATRGVHLPWAPVEPPATAQIG
ncbi:hypothetical protein GCM10025771_06240 [Niveibacterium umoris]|uniref:Diguanylate cyclase (GGDEF)-like protein/PAS domain S-box-containing protein n=1 Tax=Niveibacterium umoris TaxID=1193620 RepID=A0A840BQL9_9RHOO|nr:GGDEF and EAL domain-containing protein [Niveibacterium umoris]MBB4013828.1 diguanylate cyclase (GGDEF)-like protein/PAS domain S-box-containing protein [Niveibacterium umoris]